MNFYVSSHSSKARTRKASSFKETCSGFFYKANDLLFSFFFLFFKVQILCVVCGRGNFPPFSELKGVRSPPWRRAVQDGQPVLMPP